MSDPEPTASSQRQNNVPSPAAASSQNLNSAIRHLQHDIRTPMNHILGFSELLIYEVQPSHSDEYTASLKKIHAAGKSILGRITETFTGLSGNNGPEMLESLRQAIHVYVEQALIDTNQASEYAVASGEAFVISAIEEIRSAVNNLEALADESIQALKAEFNKSSAAASGQDLAEARPEGGVTIEASTQGSTEARPEKRKTGSSQNRLNGTILVVDDNEANCEMLSMSLKRQGHTVMVANNGRKALEQIRAQKFDLVLLDIMMPEMTGYEVLEIIKADEVLRRIPVIMISGVDDIQGVVKCIEMGAEDHLHKPFEGVLLRARINASLEKKKLRDQEIQYLEQVQELMAAAAAVEAGTFDSDSLNDIARRSDNLGQLARVFQHMAQEVFSREQRLRQEVRELRIQINEGWMQEKIDEITDTDYFHRLEMMANELRDETST